VQQLPRVTAQFVVGRAADEIDEAVLQQEMQQNPGEFLVLDVDVCPFPMLFANCIT
jgi:hypothetical protein